MPEKWWPPIYRPTNGADEREIRSWREAIARSLEILRQSEPHDTFWDGSRRTRSPRRKRNKIVLPFLL